jgi:hypothetical protein
MLVHDSIPVGQRIEADGGSMSTVPNVKTRHYAAERLVRAPIDRVFAYVDDHSQLSSHMSQSSWLMGGGRMDLQFDEGRGQRLGSKIRLQGKVFGLSLSLEEVITERVPPYRKTWQTIGSPRLLIIGQYRMGFELSERNHGSALRVFIEYSLPVRTVERWLGLLFANFYARWCTHKMIKDTVAHFNITPDVRSPDAEQSDDAKPRSKP